MLKGAIAATCGILFLPVLIASMATGTPTTAPAHVDGIDDTLLDTYIRAATTTADEDCTGMRWQILAGIGAIESDLLAGRDISPNGDVTPRVIGPRLDGSGAGGNTTPHHDTDNGQWDRDTEYDRAVGPGQHLPSTWRTHGADGNGDNVADPHNAYDSALGTARHLCAIPGDDGTVFTDPERLRDALFAYNQSDAYVDDVMSEIERFDALPPDLGGDVTTEEGQAAVAWALAQVGKPYVWGGVGPDGFDCSGLTMRAWQAAGTTIPRVTTDQYTAGTRVGLDELQPGDLIFYDTTDVGAPGPAPSHVTMYIGDGQMVNAPSAGSNVRVQPVADDFYATRFMGATRPESA